MIENKIKDLGYQLPPPPKALASYIPLKKIDKLIFTSGQLPLANGSLVHPGILGDSVTISEAQESARIAILNALAAIATLTPLDQIEIIKLGVYVASSPIFQEQHLVANGASDLLAAIFGEKGKHARFAVGVSSLPLGACIELELIVSI